LSIVSGMTTHTRSSLPSKITRTPSTFTVSMSPAPSCLRLVDRCPLACGETTPDSGSESMLRNLSMWSLACHVELSHSGLYCSWLHVLWLAKDKLQTFVCWPRTYSVISSVVCYLLYNIGFSLHWLELSPVSTTRVDGWPVSISRQHGPCWRVMETGHR